MIDSSVSWEIYQRLLGRVDEIQDPGVGGLSSLALLARQWSDADSAEKLLGRAISRCDPEVGHGLFSGQLGVAWAAELINPVKFRSFITRVERDTLAALRNQEFDHFDIISGVSGVVTLMLSGEPSEIRRKCVDLVIEELEARSIVVQDSPKTRVIATALANAELEGPAAGSDDEQTVNLGMAHGAAGVITALAHIVAERGGSRRSRKRARKLLAQFTRWFLDREPNLNGEVLPPRCGLEGPCTEAKSGALNMPLRWCYSDLSMALALRAAIPWIKDERAQVVYDKLCARVCDHVSQGNISDDLGLCHGITGVAYIVHELAASARSDLAPQLGAAWQRCRETVEGLDFAEVEDCSLLMGLPGIALILADLAGVGDKEWSRVMFIPAPRGREIVKPEAGEAEDFLVDFAIIRTGLLPARSFDEWNELVAESRPQVGARIGSAAAAARLITEDGNASLALRLASPSVWSRLKEVESDRKLALTVGRYATRMISRVAQFGLLAAYSVVELGEDSGERGEASVKLGASTDSTVIAYPSIDLTKRVARATRERRRAVNCSIYRSNDRLRYWVRSERGYDSKSIKASALVNETLSCTQGGGTDSEIIGRVAGHTGMDAEICADLINRLTDAGVLVEDLGVDAISPLPAHATIDPCFETVLGKLAELDYDAVMSSFRQLDESSLESDANLSLSRPACGATLSRGIVDGWLRTAKHLSTSYLQVADPLAAFRLAFERRFGREWVPLTFALDAELGLGDLINTSASRGPSRRSSDSPFIEAFRRHFVGQAAPEEWDISGVDVGQASADLRDVESFCVVGQIGRDGRGRPISVFNYATSPGSRLFLRSTHSERRTLSGMRSMLASVRPESVVYADLEFMPSGKLESLNSRAPIEDWKILTDGPGRIDDKVIWAHDLSVTLRDGRFHLWSQRLDREVVVRCHTALNPTLKTPPLYQFLIFCDHICSVTWDWGSLRGAARLPRVRCGEVYVCGAQWHLTRSRLARVLRATSANERMRALRAMRDRESIPRYVMAASGPELDDDRLVLDLENDLNVDLLLHNFPSGGLTIEEALPSPPECAVMTPAGPAVHRIIVPAVSKSAGAQLRVAGPSALDTADPRDWSYYLLYCSTTTQDWLIWKVIGPLMARLVEAGMISKWFFLRYQDEVAGSEHLRVRFLADPESRDSVERCFREELEPAIEAGYVWDLRTAIYMPEYERYGEGSITACEEIFFACSGFASRILQREDARPPKTRFALAVAVVLGLVECLYDAREAQAQILEQLSAGFSVDAQALVLVQVQVNDESDRREFDEVVAFYRDDPALKEYMSRVARILERDPIPPRAGPSIIHMAMNRLFVESRVEWESAAYSTASRIFESRPVTKSRVWSKGGGWSHRPSK